jgi:hypothetical protein
MGSTAPEPSLAQAFFQHLALQNGSALHHQLQDLMKSEETFTQHICGMETK